MAANKTDLVNEIQTKVEEILEDKGVTLNKKEATAIVDAFLDTIIDLAIEHEKLSLVGFGNFELRERASRTGYNPKLLQELKEQGLSEEEAKTKAQVEISASKNIALKAGKRLKNL